MNTEQKPTCDKCHTGSCLYIGTNTERIEKYKASKISDGYKVPNNSPVKQMGQWMPKEMCYPEHIAILM